MSNIPYNYGSYIDAKVNMTNNGTVDAGRQIQSPASAGSRGLAKTTQFTNNKTQMQLGQEAIAESMVEIRSIINRIDGVNAPVQEAPKENEQTVSEDIDEKGRIALEKAGFDPMKVKEYMAVFNDHGDTSDIDQMNMDKVGLADAMSMVLASHDVENESYQPMPEGDEFDIEEDEDFEEVLGPLGFPEDETELFDAEYQGRKVPLNKPMRGDVKKFKVYVKDPKTGNVKKVNFGHGGTSAKRKTMRIRKSNPKARKSFRARHNCANPGPKTKARYWSCRKW
jgi:hypothetical protein